MYIVKQTHNKLRLKTSATVQICKKMKCPDHNKKMLLSAFTAKCILEAVYAQQQKMFFNLCGD